jgi:hypothetical protein
LNDGSYSTVTTWPAATLVDGVYDMVMDFPMTANLTGHQTITVHLNRVAL